MNEFNFSIPTELHFGVESLKSCGSKVKALGRRALLVTMAIEPYMEQSIDSLKKTLEESGLTVDIYSGAVANPTLESVEAGSKAAKECKADVVIGFGGGSAMDTAKAIAVGASHEGSLWDYIWSSDNQPSGATLPIVAIPTTSGTGSQVTQVSVFTNDKLKYKSAIYNKEIFPKLTIIDPTLMTTVPKSVTAATGFDVFTHAFESYIHANSNPLVKVLAEEAIKLVGQYLPIALKEPKNVEARTNMAIADTLAGMCIANAGVTLPHGMGMAIGGFYPHIAHGEALAIIYPEFVKFTEESMPQAFDMIRKYLSPESDSVIEAIETFLENIGLRKALRDYGVEESDLNDLAVQCMVLPDYQANPRVASEDEMRLLVQAIF